MRSIYLLLVRTNTLYSRMIHLFTKAPYTHVALIMDPAFSRMYSFSQPFFPFSFRGGFVWESLNKGVYRHSAGANCAIYELIVTADAYGRIQCRIARMLRERRRWRYNFRGALSLLHGRTFSRDYRYFSSEFVADTLLRCGALKLSVPVGLIRPSDFASMPGLELIYNGPLWAAQIQSQSAAPTLLENRSILYDPIHPLR